MSPDLARLGFRLHCLLLLDTRGCLHTYKCYLPIWHSHHPMSMFHAMSVIVSVNVKCSAVILDSENCVPLFGSIFATDVASCSYLDWLAFF